MKNVENSKAAVHWCFKKRPNTGKYGPEKFRIWTFFM